MSSRRLLQQLVLRGRPLAPHITSSTLRPAHIRFYADDSASNTPSTSLYDSLVSETLEDAKDEKPKRKRRSDAGPAKLKLDENGTRIKPIRKKRSDTGTKRAVQLDENGQPIKKVRARRVSKVKGAESGEVHLKATAAHRERSERGVSDLKMVNSKGIGKRTAKTLAIPRYYALKPLADLAGHGDSDFASGSVTRKADHSRMNIINPELCDQVIERLGSSLDKHEGCDIIDISPGIGIWSAKLHERLKPRTHILMEPDALYHQKLGKLVEEDPTYKLLPVSGIIWNNLLKLESEGHLPNQTFRTNGDPELEKPNNTLLVSVNIGYFPRRSYIGFQSMAQLVHHQLITASRTHSLFQAYGQIRMLVWMHDFEKRILLPRTVALRKKSAIEAEVALEYMQEVCGGDMSFDTAQREEFLNIESTQRVSEKMKKAGITTPEHRKSRLLKLVESDDSESSDTVGGYHRTYAEEIDELEKGLTERMFPAAYHKETNAPAYLDEMETGMHRTHIYSREYDRYKELKYRKVANTNFNNISFEFVSEYERIAEEYIAAFRSTSPDRAQRMEAAKDGVNKWLETLNLNPLRRVNNVLGSITERHALHQDPPILLWDRREYEPLLTSKEDFHPKQEMCLLDIVPRTVWPVLRGNSLGDYDFFELLLGVLTLVPSDPVKHRLRGLAPGADEWIIPRCPSLMDPTKGGVPNLELLPTRGLNEIQLREICEEFMAWPFRPSKGRLLQSAGSSNVTDEQRSEDDLGVVGRR